MKMPDGMHTVQATPGQIEEYRAARRVVEKNEARQSLALRWGILSASELDEIHVFFARRRADREIDAWFRTRYRTVPVTTEIVHLPGER
jgi:hypothetical protein